MSTVTTENKKTSRSFLFFGLVTSISFSFYYIDLGFAFKPYMILSIIIFLLTLKTFVIHKLETYEIALLVFFIYYMSTGFLSKYPMSSLRMILGVLLVLFCYLVMRFILSRVSIQSIEKSISASGIIFNALSIVLYIMGLVSINFILIGNGFSEYGLMMDRNFPRLIGLTTDPNIYTFYNFIFFFYYLTHLDKKWSKLGVSLSGLTMLLSMSRGGLMSIAFGLILMFFSANLKRKVKMSIVIPALAYIFNLVVKVIVNVDMLGMIIERFTASDGGSGRSEIWMRGIHFFQQSPVFGIGIFNYRDYSLETFGTDMYIHNTYLEALVEGGLIGIILYFIALMLFAITYMNNRKNINDKGYLIFSFVAVVVMMSTYTLMVNEIFFFLLALFWRYLHELRYPNKFEEPKEKVRKRKRYRITW